KAGVRVNALQAGTEARLVLGPRVAVLGLHAAVRRAGRFTLRPAGLGRRLRLADVDDRPILRVFDRDADDEVAPGAAGEQVAAGGVHRKPANDQFLPGPREADLPRIAEQPAVEVKLVDDLELAAAGVQPSAVG